MRLCDKYLLVGIQFMFTAMVTIVDFTLDFILWLLVSPKDALIVRLGSTVAVFGPICIFI